MASGGRGDKTREKSAAGKMIDSSLHRFINSMKR
jgi:hypothetical protein